MRRGQWYRLVFQFPIREHERLVNAAQVGSAMGFIMRPVRNQGTLGRQLSGLKIHSNLYH
ncbi:hypothetical protein B9T52_23870 [Klebsiella pneumoniae]|nr:hypothetical protein B9T51_23255 [Klebsiella pneumoniae]OSP68488.1 hypothetical protein B9T52_23870 [Klebsiella pneumoniae]OSP72202.1 hypothetical protein B9G97_22840 [Klebsiella pneumoniae]